MSVFFLYLENLKKMKTTSATINLMLLTSKRNKKGECRIILRISYSGYADVSTGIMCKPEQWDKRHQRMKGTSPEVAAINKRLSELKQSAEALRISYENMGLPYTCHDLVPSGNAPRLRQRRDLQSVFEEMAKQAHFVRNSIIKYQDCINNLSKYMKKDSSSILITEITESNTRGWCAEMKNRLLKNSTIADRCYKIGAICHYANAQGYMLREQHPFYKWKYRKDYKPEHHHKSLSAIQMKVIKAYIDFNLGGKGNVTIKQILIHYKTTCEYSTMKCDQSFSFFNEGDRLTEDDRNLRSCNSGLTALALFYLGYKMQGLAAVDMANLHFSDLEECAHAYKLSICRSKTRREVPIVIEKGGLEERLIQEFKEDASRRNSYLFPLRDPNAGNPDGKYNRKHSDDEDKVFKRNNWFINRKLKKMWARLNDIMSRQGIREWEPLSDDFSYYSMRHTFATVYMQSGGNVIDLASMLGRKPDDIGRYIASLNVYERVSEAKKSMPV